MGRWEVGLARKGFELSVNEWDGWVDVDVDVDGCLYYVWYGMGGEREVGRGAKRRPCPRSSFIIHQLRPPWSSASSVSSSSVSSPSPSSSSSFLLLVNSIPTSTLMAWGSAWLSMLWYRHGTMTWLCS